MIMELNEAVLDCMQTLRRRLRDEQQLDIRLSQPDAITAMLSACRCSDDEQTRNLGAQLAAYTQMPVPLAGPSTLPQAPGAYAPPVRIYRGQKVTG